MTHKTFTLSTALQAAALAVTLASSSAMAQAWPSRPISLIVPFPAGGTTDVLARAVGLELSKSLGQPVIVESKPGAGSQGPLLTRLLPSPAEQRVPEQAHASTL